MPQALTRRLRLLISALLLTAGAIGLAGQRWAATAQDLPPAIDQASLRLWPEYDDPGLLVIFAGVFTNTASFPRQVAFPIPAAARGIQATVVAANGDLLSQPWQITDGKLTYTLPQPAFQIEFYLDRPPSGNQRDIRYTFETDYAIKSLTISFQQPARATGFATTPQPEQSFQGSDGFTYYSVVQTDVAAGARLPLNMRYTKNDQGLSVAQAQPAATDAALDSGAPSASTARGLPTWLPYLLIGLGLAVLAAVAGYWYVRIRPLNEPVTAATPQSRSAGQSGGSRPSAAIFCTQCGHRFAAEDRFCAACGAPRKGQR